jgi:hypothetical protein
MTRFQVLITGIAYSLLLAFSALFLDLPPIPGGSMSHPSRPFFVNLFPEKSRQSASSLDSPVPLASNLPLDWLFDPTKDRSLVDRVLARLVQAEAHAETVPGRQHWRQCFITVSLAAKGSPIPFVESSLICYGLHPDKLWPAIVARRKAELGTEYSLWYDAAGNLRPDAPKKDSASTRERKTGVA